MIYSLQIIKHLTDFVTDLKISSSWSSQAWVDFFSSDLGLRLVSPWCWDFGNWLKATKKISDVSLCFEVSKRSAEYLTRVRYATTWKRACEIARGIVASVSSSSFSSLQGFWRMETKRASAKTHRGPKDKKYWETLGQILSLLEVKAKRILFANARVASFVYACERVVVCTRGCVWVLPRVLT